jgi:hypothetical protein
LLQDADMFLHAGEGHVEALRQRGDRRVGSAELLEDAASGGVGERAEGGVDVGSGILNHVVQYTTPSDGVQ